MSAADWVRLAIILVVALYVGINVSTAIGHLRRIERRLMDIHVTLLDIKDRRRA